MFSTNSTSPLLFAIVAFTLPVVLIPFITSAATCTDIYSNRASVPTGYGAAYNLFSAAHEPMVKTSSCTDTSASVTVGNGDASTFIYKQGYQWTGTAWSIIDFTSTNALVSNLWYRTTANGTIPLLSGTTGKYYVAYTCQQINSEWKCGCHDSTCTTPAWQLQRVTKTTEIADPTATFTANPTSITTGSSSILTWASTDVQSCTGTNFSTGNQTAGSVTVSPVTTTTYNLSCTNGTTNVTKSATVAVDYNQGGATCGNNICEMGETMSCSQDCSSGIGPNLVLNSDFETGTTSWTSSSPGEFSPDTTLSHTGNTSLRLTTSDSLATARSTKFTLLPNRFYRITASMNAPVPPEIRIEQFNVGGASEPSYPLWAGVIAGPGWQTISTVFVTAPDVIQGQVYLLLKENGSVNYDDISVQLLPVETPFALGAGAGVDFLGHPSIMGMRIVDSQLSQDGKSFSLDTTAAHFQFDANTGILRCTQTLGGTRERATVQLPLTTGSMKVVMQDADRMILSTNKFDIAFHGDSMVVMALTPGTQATVNKSFTQSYYGYRQGFLTAIDDIGGVAVFPDYQRGTGLTNSYTVSAGAGTPPSSLTYTFGQGGKLAVAVFPPRPFDWQRSFDDQIIHSDGYPSKSVLQDWGTVGKVIVLHEGIWQGEVIGKFYLNYTPVDAVALQRVIDDAHSLGLKVLPYFSSDFFPVTMGDTFINEVKRLRDIYGFDGVYYDGINAYNWEYAYETMRRTRDLFPAGPVYFHETYGVPFRKSDFTVFLPQIDALADYTMKGESVDINGWDDPYLVYAARGYNVSNTIGTLKYDAMKVNGNYVTLAQVLPGLLNLNMRERITAYPSSGIYPTAASFGSSWTSYRAQVANMKAQWEAGLLP